MSKRRQFTTKGPCYPSDEWHVIERPLHPEDNAKNESIFAVANGHVGIRATFEEGYSGPGRAGPGVFINGFFERHDIRYPETAFGYARYDERMVPVCNCLPIQLMIQVDFEVEAFDMFTGTVVDYTRVLSMQNGEMTRSVVWRSPRGREVEVVATRFCSQTRPSLVVMNYQVTALNCDCLLSLSSQLDGKAEHFTPHGGPVDPRLSDLAPSLQTIYKKQGGTYAALEQRTFFSNFFMVCAMDNEVHCSSGKPVAFEEEAWDLIQDEKVGVRFAVPLKQGQSVTLTKFVSYITSRDMDKDELHRTAQAVVAEAKQLGYEAIRAENRVFFEDFWKAADIEIRGDSYLQQGIRFNLFHLLQSVGREGRTNIGAKGLTGQGYNGHYFWDTEIYIIPFFLYTHPEYARALLMFRYYTLDAARKRAREINLKKGCLFSWRTISGEECSSYFPASTAQVHINADICYCIKSYIEATNDQEFLLKYGAEIVFESARSYIELGVWERGSFQIHGVTGPDEYTALVDNNYYTNIMAQATLEYAHRLYDSLSLGHAEELQAITAKIDLRPAELEAFKQAALKMWLPQDHVLGVHPQDDSFLKKKSWDFENTPRDSYPLLMHFHPLVIYKHRVCKQADVILAHYMLGNRFTLKEKKADFDYYEPITTHDSSLSVCIFSVVAAEIGYHTKAYEYFMNTARMDLDDINRNASHGIHTACMGGTWLCVVPGFAGMRVYNNMLSFDPYLPMEWDGYSFRVRFHGALLRVVVSERTAEYTLLEGRSLRFIHSSTTRVSLKAGKTVTLRLKDKFTDIATLEFDGVIVEIDAFIRNLDSEQAQAWIWVLNSFLELRSKRDSREYAPITPAEYEVSLKHGITEDYRYLGLQLFLMSRGIDLPLGSSMDAVTAPTLCGLGNAKRAKFRESIEDCGLKTDPGIINLIKDLRDEGIPVAAVSYSKNCRWMLEKGGLSHLFNSIVDGDKFSQLGLRGAPFGDIFSRAAEEMATQPRRCVVLLKDIRGYSVGSMKHFKFIITAMEPSSGKIAAAPPAPVSDLSLSSLSSEYMEQAVANMVRSEWNGVTTDVLEDWVKLRDTSPPAAGQATPTPLRRRGSGLISLLGSSSAYHPPQTTAAGGSGAGSSAATPRSGQFPGRPPLPRGTLGSMLGSLSGGHPGGRASPSSSPSPPARPFPPSRVEGSPFTPTAAPSQPTSVPTPLNLCCHDDPSDSPPPSPSAGGPAHYPSRPGDTRAFPGGLPPEMPPTGNTTYTSPPRARQDSSEPTDHAPPSPRIHPNPAPAGEENPPHTSTAWHFLCASPIAFLKACSGLLCLRCCDAPAACDTGVSICISARASSPLLRILCGPTLGRLGAPSALLAPLPSNLRAASRGQSSVGDAPRARVAARPLPN
eukprot:RCo007337